MLEGFTGFLAPPGSVFSEKGHPLGSFWMSASRGLNIWADCKSAAQMAQESSKECGGAPMVEVVDGELVAVWRRNERFGPETETFRRVVAGEEVG